MRVPLLATLIVLIFRQTGRLPKNKNRLYEMFVDQLSGGWDLAKGIIHPTTFGRSTKKIVLAALANKIHRSHSREFFVKDIGLAVREALPTASASDYVALPDELLMDGVVVQSGAVIQFAHLSLQEYLAAHYFAREERSNELNEALKAYLWGDSWWKEVLKFHIGLFEEPHAAIQWLTPRIRMCQSIEPWKFSLLQVNELLVGILESFPEFAVEQIVEPLSDCVDEQETFLYLNRIKESYVMN